MCSVHGYFIHVDNVDKKTCIIVLLTYRHHLFISDDFVNSWTGKPLPKQHLQVNKNSSTQNIVLSVGVVLVALVILHVLLSINNCVKKIETITYV